MRLARPGLWLAAAAVLLPTAAFAAGDMPQLRPHDLFPQLVWLVILFTVLYVLLSTVAIPRISATLEARDAKITGDLAAAEKANEDARGLIEAYQKRLADARANARGLTREREEADSAAAAARLAEIGERIGAQIRRGREAHRRPEDGRACRAGADGERSGAERLRQACRPTGRRDCAQHQGG